MHDIQCDCSLMECAKEMIRESLPIKCLEAVVLAMYPLILLNVKQQHSFNGQFSRHQR